MDPAVEVISVRGSFGSGDARALGQGLDAAFAAGAKWVAVDLSAAEKVEAKALIGVSRRERVVVCGGDDGLLRELTAAGVIATRRLLDVRIAARAQQGDGLKRRFELLALPRL